MHPSPTSDGDNWRITEDKDHINLKFNVGESTRKDKLEVATADQVLLTVRYTAAATRTARRASWTPAC